MKMKLFVLVSAILLIGSGYSGAFADDSIVLRSGNGIIGGTDSQVTMLVGPANSPFAAAFTPADFANADAGPAAFIVVKNPIWKAGLDSDGLSQWISTILTGGTTEGSTALYSIDFSVTCPAIDSATLDIDFLTDNELGDANNEGLYVNGSPLAGSKLLGLNLAHFQVDQSFPTFDISSLVNSGPNTLYLNAPDGGGPSGLQFSANIEVKCADAMVGGEFIPIDTVSLLLAGAQSSMWLVPLMLSIIGFGVFVVSRKPNNS
jgi:hypothetical protein